MIDGAAAAGEPLSVVPTRIPMDPRSIIRGVMPCTARAKTGETADREHRRTPSHRDCPAGGAASVGQEVSSEPVRGVDDPELTELLELVGERVREYYRDIENLAWTTTIRHEVFEDDWSPKEAPKDLVFESIVLLEPPPDDFPVPFVVREESDLTHVDGASVDPDRIRTGIGLPRYWIASPAVRHR